MSFAHSMLRCESLGSYHCGSTSGVCSQVKMDTFNPHTVSCQHRHFEILNLSEKYQTKELHDKVDRQIKHFPLTMENVVKVASTTQEFFQFNSLSENLYTRCVAFIEEHCASVPSILTLIQGNEDKVTVMALLQDMKATQIPPKHQDDCSKCKVQESKTCFNRNKKPCRKGKLVFRLDAPRPGTRLRSLHPDFPT